MFPFFFAYLLSLYHFFPVEKERKRERLLHTLDLRNIVTSATAADTEYKAAMIYLFQPGALCSVFAVFAVLVSQDDLAVYSHNLIEFSVPPSPPSDVSQPTLGRS